MARNKIALRKEAADALAVFGQQIKGARIARRWSVADTAARVGVSPTTYAAIERGAAGTAIGTVFNAASLLGVPLFATDDPVELARMRRTGEREMALLARSHARSTQAKPVQVDGFPA